MQYRSFYVFASMCGIATSLHPFIIKYKKPFSNPNNIPVQTMAEWVQK